MPARVGTLLTVLAITAWAAGPDGGSPAAPVVRGSVGTSTMTINGAPSMDQGMLRFVRLHSPALLN